MRLSNKTTSKILAYPITIFSIWFLTHGIYLIGKLNDKNNLLNFSKDNPYWLNGIGFILFSLMGIVLLVWLIYWSILLYRFISEQIEKNIK